MNDAAQSHPGTAIVKTASLLQKLFCIFSVLTSHVSIPEP